MSDAWAQPTDHWHPTAELPEERLAAGLVMVRRHTVDVEDTGRVLWQLTVQVGPREALRGGGGAKSLPDPVRAALRAWLAVAEVGES